MGSARAQAAGDAEVQGAMARLNWRQKALYDDAYGRRFDRWFGAGAGLGLLIAGLTMGVVGVSDGAILGTVIMTVAGLLILLAAWAAPVAISPLSLLFLGLAGAFFHLRPGLHRPGKPADNPESDSR